jgi:hypothetical protein
MEVEVVFVFPLARVTMQAGTCRSSQARAWLVLAVLSTSLLAEE